MTWLIACEESGRVRDALLSLGEDAVSCDILPTSVEGPHIQGDVREQLSKRWTGIIAFPPCTRLTNAGVRWLAERNLWDEMYIGVDLFNQILRADCPRIAVENPIMHKHARSLVIEPYQQIVHPWWFGDPYQKATCLWLKGLPELTATHPKPRVVHQRVWKMAPSKERSRLRSLTPHGMAKEMARQWSQPQI